MYIYGPVASRRLGSSLGIDLVPHKVCDYDCVYCQLGRTTRKTLRKEPYVPASSILEELERALERAKRPDYITIAGSGEPTLNSELEKVIDGAGRMCDIPIAVITNGSLLGDAEVSRACRKADLVIPSLDATDEEAFQAVNRPCSGITAREIAEGLISFREGFTGALWVEVMLIEGINDDEDMLASLNRSLERIRPDRVQLNTVARPPVEDYARPLEHSKLERLAGLFGCGAEVIGEIGPGNPNPSGSSCGESVLESLARRPCTIEDIAVALEINYVEASKILSGLVAEGLVFTERHGGAIYFVAR